MLIFLFFQIQVAHASFVEERLMCTSVSTIRAKIEYCYQNEEFVVQARPCLDRYVESINSAGERLQSSSVDRGNQAAIRQDSKFINHTMNLSDSAAELKNKIQMGIKLRAEFIQYRKNLMMPGNPDPKTLRVADLIDNQASWCYRTFANQLAQLVRQIDRYLLSLETARAAAVSIELEAKASLDKLKQNPQQEILKESKRANASGEEPMGLDLSGSGVSKARSETEPQEYNK